MAEKRCSIRGKLEEPSLYPEIRCLQYSLILSNRLTQIDRPLTFCFFRFSHIVTITKSCSSTPLHPEPCRGSSIPNPIRPMQWFVLGELLSPHQSMLQTNKVENTPGQAGNPPISADGANESRPTLAHRSPKASDPGPRRSSLPPRVQRLPPLRLEERLPKWKARVRLPAQQRTVGGGVAATATTLRQRALPAAEDVSVRGARHAARAVGPLARE